MPRLEIATASRVDVERLIDWAALEGWNPGLGDIDPFLAGDPEGFLVGRIGPEMVAGISVVRTGETFGFLGHYIVAPAHRGRGHGLQLWKAGMARLGGRTIGLDGVLAQQENYRTSGFAFAHRNIRFGGHVHLDSPDAAGIEPIRPAHLDALIAYDSAHFGLPRPAFLFSWLAPDHGRRGRVMLVDGRVRGYGVIRPCIEGFKIGPLFADDEAIADALFTSLARTTAGATLYLDPPEPNPAAIRLAGRHGLKPVFETARMYRGEAPELPLASIFGITTFELG